MLRGCICSVQISFWRWITDSRKSSNCLDSPHVPGTVSRILAACVLPTLRLGAVELEAQGAKSERVLFVVVIVLVLGTATQTSQPQVLAAG